jgi:hypothetical protein
MENRRVRGVGPALIEHRGTGAALKPAELERWLLASGLAEPNGEPGRLVPTPAALALGAALE